MLNEEEAREFYKHKSNEVELNCYTTHKQKILLRSAVSCNVLLSVSLQNRDYGIQWLLNFCCLHQ